MQYKPYVARLSTIHSPPLEPGTHDVSYHLPSNPSSPFSSKQGSCTRWCHPASSSLPSPLPSQLSCFPMSLSSPLSIFLVLHVGVCYVIPLVDVFPSTVVSNTVRPCNPLSVYHACYCFLMDKKENSVHMNI